MQNQSVAIRMFQKVNRKSSAFVLKLESLEDRTTPVATPIPELTNALCCPGCGGTGFCACPPPESTIETIKAPTAGDQLHPLTDIPVLNSLSSASASLYLDFNGHFEPVWGSFSNLTTPVYDRDGDLTSFSDTEIANMIEIWERVAEDFSFLNINVTTVQPASFGNGEALRIAIGGSWADWYGSPAGGLGYVDSFTDDIVNTVYVFSGIMSKASYVAEASSHEAGHGFGLNHQSLYNGTTKVEEYNPGGNGWAPIMGVGYYQPVTTWFNGPNTFGWDSLQDDISILAKAENGFGFRSDDEGDTTSTAKNLGILTNSDLTANSVINSISDADVYSFSVTSSGTASINVKAAQTGANLDTRFDLLNSSGNVIGTSNPDNTLNSSLSLELTPGTYYIRVQGNGQYGWLGQYSLAVSKQANSPGTITMADSKVFVGESDGVAEIVVHRVGGSNGSVTVNYTTSDGTATENVDYTKTTGTLTFADGQTTQTIFVPITSDGITETLETFYVTLSEATGGATLSGSTFTTVNIVDNEVPGILTITSAQWNVGEAGPSIAVVVKREIGTDGDISVLYETINGTALANQDYTSKSGTLTFLTGETTKTVSIPISEDLLVEGKESFSFNIFNPTGGAFLGAVTTANISIIDNELPGVFDLEAETLSVNEAAGVALIIVQRTNGSDGEVTVQFATEQDTATADTDFEPISGTLTFAPGELVKTIEVPIVNDSQVETLESFKLSLSAPGGGASLGTTSTITISIVDNEVPGTIALANSAVTVNETGSFAAIIITRTGGSDGMVTVSYTTANGSAIAGADYTLTFGTLTFQTGETSKTVNVPILNDTHVESTETFSLTISNVTGGATLGSLTTIIVSIINDDLVENQPPTANANGIYEVSEGVPVTLSGAGSTDPENDALNYSWDLNLDGVFGDATGSNPVLSLSQLKLLGMNDDGLFTATLRVDDGNGHFAYDSAEIRILNAAPDVGAIGGPNSTLLTKAINFQVAFTDLGSLDSHSATIEWGDGSIEPAIIQLVGGVPTITGVHTYASGGAYTLKVAVTDDDGGTTIAQKVLNIMNAFVMEDTVTGGQSLFIIGNETADNITAVTNAQTKEINVTVNGLTQGLFDPSTFTRIVLDTRGGNDLVTFDAGVVVPASMTGGLGNDTLVAGSAADTIYGNDGDDFLFGQIGSDLIFGGTGNDGLDGGADNDTIVGEDGNEYISGGSGADSLLGDEGADGFDAGDGNDFVDGGAGNDFAYGFGGNDTMFGRDGSDGIDAGAGNDFVDAGLGNDFMYGLDGADTMIGSDGDDGIDGGAGDDSLIGGIGNDLLFGAAGNDSISGGAGKDRMNGDAGDDTLDGGTEDDLIFASGGGVDLVFGGAGNDTLQNIDSNATIYGGSGNDMLYGANFIADSLLGEDGNDTIFALSGNDTISGGSGADLVDGGAGTDSLTDAQSGDILFNVP